MSRSEELKSLLTKYDTQYRLGTPIVPDSVYDGLVDELISLIGAEDPFFKSSIKTDLNISNRRDIIPIEMKSMNKCKTVSELHDWLRLKGIPNNTILIISPKYDGCSLAKEEATDKAWTRGSDDKGGLRSDEHLKFMNDIKYDCDYTFGEVIISRTNFTTIKNSFDGDSARNAVAGLFRRDYVSDELSYVNFIRYGAIGKHFKTKQEVFDYLNKKQLISVPYKLTTVDKLTEENLKELFIEYSKDFEIDGLILEINDISLWNKLGRERNGNPKWAVAYKGNFEEIGETICTDIENNISKEGNVIPVAVLKPIKLDGALVSRVTLNNYSFMKEMGIGIGSKVLVKRSGMVIPLITEVLTKKPFVYSDLDCHWDGVHLKMNEMTPEQEIKKLYSFFNIIGVEGISDKTFELLYNSGYTTVKSILNMSIKDFEELDGYAIKKATNLYNAIQSKTKDIPLSKLQHASGFFTGLGSKKLFLLEDINPNFDNIIGVEGFSEISANNYLNGIDEFNEFIADLPITVKKTEVVQLINEDLKDKVFVFTGFRNNDIETEIKKRGGIISSSVSSKTNYLVMKEKGSGSSKELKALELGVTVFDKDEIYDFINKK
jgi:DNA ligase (NAD+)